MTRDCKVNWFYGKVQILIKQSPVGCYLSFVGFFSKDDLMQIDKIPRNMKNEDNINAADTFS